MYSQRIGEIVDYLNEEIKDEEEEQGYLLIGGDFNIRTDNEEGSIRIEGIEDEERKSRDKVINKKEQLLIKKLKERGWMIINGCFGRLEEWKYIGETESSIIDYAIANRKSIRNGR